jgi:hypothetical protein
MPWKLLKQKHDVLVCEESVLHTKLLRLREQIDGLERELQAACPHAHVERERDYDAHSSFWWYSCQDCGLLSRQPFGSWQAE